MTSTLPADATCLGCGYVLRGLPETRCPECGQEFRPGSPSTYRSRLTPKEHRRRRVQRAAWVTDARTGMLLLWPLGLLAVFNATLMMPFWRMRVMLGFTVGVTALVWASVQVRRRLAGGRPRGRWLLPWGLIAASLVLARTRPLVWPMLWVSLPAIARAEARIDRPLGSYPARGHLGVLPASRLERCGHGLHIVPLGSMAGNARGPGLFRRDVVGHCEFAPSDEDTLGWRFKP